MTGAHPSGLEELRDNTQRVQFGSRSPKTGNLGKACSGEAGLGRGRHDWSLGVLLQLCVCACLCTRARSC